MYNSDEGGFDVSKQMLDEENFSSTQSPSKQRAAKGTGKSKFSNDSKQVTPVTIRQLFGAKQGRDESFEIDGVTVGLVSFVGKIVSSVAKENMTSYMIDDTTGIIEVKIWANDEFIKSKREVWTEQKYVRVYGHLRQWESKNSIVSFRFNLINDMNEITYHLLDVIHAHLYNSKGGLPTSNPRLWEQENAKNPSSSATQSFQNTQQRSAAAPSQALSSHATTASSDLYSAYDDDETAFQKASSAVLSVVRSANGTHSGIHVDDIYSSLSGTFDVNEIAKAINYLGTEGHIYNSIDDYHLKCQ